MPALNIDFTEAELAELRKQAAAEGVSLRTLAHDTLVSRTRRELDRAVIRAAYAEGKAASEELLRRLASE
jgi:hypothetical protein